MENQNIDKIERVEFPNTENSDEGYVFSKSCGFSFKGIMKNGEMAAIQWIQIYDGEKLLAEIKESVCNLFYN